jgi:hypothetical protein
MRPRIVVIAIVLIFAAIGAHSLNLRELYQEMYPLEPVKHDAFNICGQADPTFVRAVGADREACYDSMPHEMAVAMGRIPAGGDLSMEALIGSSRAAALLLTLASMPPRQPITARRSFADTGWLHALSAPCDDRRAASTAAYTAPVPRPSGTARAAALDETIRGNLPPLPHPARAGHAHPNALPVIPLAPAAAPPPPAADSGDKTSAVDPLPVPDIGDRGPPAIVPIPSATSCGGA